MEQLLVIIIVLVSAAGFACHIYRIYQGDNCGCGCNGCEKSERCIDQVGLKKVKYKNCVSVDEYAKKAS
jgi:hypothetical protein